MGSPPFDDRGISKKTGGKRQIMEVNKMDKNVKHYPLAQTVDDAPALRVCGARSSSGYR